MEWSSEFHQFSPLEETLFGIFPPPQSHLSQSQPQNLHLHQHQHQLQIQPPMEMPMAMHKPREWTREENKLFESAIAEIDPNSPSFFEKICAKVPWKSIHEVKAHYEALIHDVQMIESGNFPVLEYPSMDVVRRELPLAPNNKRDRDQMKEKEKGKEKAAVQEVGSPSNSNELPRTKSGQPRRRGVPWTEEEHQLFLMGLNKYGKGDWRSISRYYVITKTPTQVASHAQKYFRRQNSSTPADRRRPSIHDIHTVNPATAAAASANFNSAVLPSFPSFHHSYGIGAHVLEQNPPPFMPPFMPANAAYNHHHNINNNNNNSFFFPSHRNQHWG